MNEYVRQTRPPLQKWYSQFTMHKDWLLNVCWPSPAKWFLVPSSKGLMAIILLYDGSVSFQTILHKYRLRQRQTYVTTDGQSASLSWCQAPPEAQDQIVITVRQLRGLLMWGTLSDERTSLLFTTAAGPRQRSHSQVLMLIFYCLRFETPQRGGPQDLVSARASQETHYFSATKINRLMLFKETTAVYCENHANHAECRVLACWSMWFVQ
jgi:hypothetical protein